MADRCNRSCGRCKCCTDIPPDNVYTCYQQAVVFGKCGEAFMQGRCDRSCGRCSF
jgi:hypothetical protein